eukprot:7116622-Pyramimonas_sp.AAC.1
MAYGRRAKYYATDAHPRHAEARRARVSLSSDGGLGRPCAQPGPCRCPPRGRHQGRRHARLLGKCRLPCH